ncbi:MAG: hypothetical protein RQ761_01010 [Bacteroidales bacterium]|nr:hypothetical protein [Bacteroidales bacterium]
MPTWRALISDVKKQKRYVRNVLEPDIQKAMNNNDGSLDEEDFRKIRGYYGFGVPAIVGEGFCTLRGRAMSEKERLANTYQGALTGLFDDFFDKTNPDRDDILKMMNNPEVYHAQSSLERLFVDFLSKVHKNIDNKQSFALTFRQVFDAQVESQAQMRNDITLDQIRTITFSKGGHSLLFYRSVFENKLSDTEEEALFTAGGLMQLGNDIFDVWKDAPQNIKTLVTACENISKVREVFKEQMNKTLSLFEQTSFPRTNIRRYLHKLVLGISRCYVCLDQLEGLEKQSSGQFNPSAYSREEMICDMEKPLNMFRSVRYYLNYTF